MTAPGVAYDRRVELQAFENTKAGVKGLVDAGITTIPAMFRHPPESLEGITSPSDNVAAIPTLDLSAARRDDAVALVRHAARTVGFFQVVNHGVPADRSSWPACSRRSVVTDYGEAVTKVVLCVLELLSECLGLSSDHLREMGCAHSLNVACQYYPPCPEPHLTLGHKRHTDEGFLTVLLPDGMPGLQVLVDRSGAGGTWVDVPHVPGALMINIGDLLQLVSNDQFRSAEHRVLANKSKDTARVSVASFFNTDMSRSTLYRPITNGHNPPIYPFQKKKTPRSTGVTAQEFMATFMSIGFDGRLLDYYRLEQDPPTPHV
ncbi:hypothetical protein ACQ4PT_038139 [Festuca glaucescens]